MKSLLLLASLLPAAIAANQDVSSSKVTDEQLKLLSEAKIEKSLFSSMHETIMATHGLAAKTNPKIAMVNGKKMFKMGKANISRRGDLVKKLRANTNDRHTVVVAVKQRNVDKLEKILYDVSDPKSPLYGKHWTREQMTEFTANPASTAFVKKYFEKRGARAVSETKNGEYVTFEAPVGLWENIFQTEFFEYEQTGKAHKVLRSEEAFLPQVLPQHVQHVFNIIDFPDEIPVVTQSIRAAKKEKMQKIEEKLAAKKVSVQDSDTIPGMVTPAFLDSFYQIASNTGNPATTQAVYESLNQSYSPSDLTLFQQRFNLPVEAVANDVGGHVFDNACVADGGNNCLEANLDVQYMMAVAQSVPMTYYYDENWMLKFVESVADMADPPKVISISYGGGEPSTQSYVQTFDTEAMKLGIMGVTIVASSGDDGVASFQARNRPIYCGYHPSFPATSPYVTAVGGTFGPEDNQPEVACTSDAGGVITTGGGFSNMYATPSWQQSQVTGYFNQVMGTNLQPVKGYNTQGRGYPDVSALSASYAVMAAGNLTSVYGTSASSPVVAGMIALVNSARVSAGKSNLGWINPSIYANQNAIVLNDIVIGENNCVAGHSDAVCCSQGFYATPGWDPVTGIGSLDFSKFQTTFLALGDTPNAPTASPTVTPGSPTAMPVATPTLSPSAMPTASPTTAAGWLTYSIYSMESCTGDATIVTGTPTNKCLLEYSTEAPYNVIGSQQYFCSDDSTFATIATYSDQGCTQEVGRSTLFLGCTPDYPTTMGVSQSTSLTCTAGSVNPNSLPLPSPASSSSAAYSTHLSYNQKSNACLDADLAGFTSFLNGYCFSERLDAETTYSQRYVFPAIEMFNEAGCPTRSQTVTVYQEQSCVPNTADDDVQEVAPAAAASVQQQKQHLKKKKNEEKEKNLSTDVSAKTEKTEDVATENYYYSYYTYGPSGTSRVYGRAVMSSVSSSSGESSSSDSDDFFDHKAAVSVVFILVGIVFTALVGGIVYFACLRNPAKSPLLGNQM